MSSYFQRLAQRTGLFGTNSDSSGAVPRSHDADAPFRVVEDTREISSGSPVSAPAPVPAAREQGDPQRFGADGELVQRMVVGIPEQRLSDFPRAMPDSVRGRVDGAGEAGADAHGQMSTMQHEIIARPVSGALTADDGLEPATDTNIERSRRLSPWEVEGVRGEAQPPNRAESDTMAAPWDRSQQNRERPVSMPTGQTGSAANDTHALPRPLELSITDVSAPTLSSTGPEGLPAIDVVSQFGAVRNGAPEERPELPKVERDPNPEQAREETAGVSAAFTTSDASSEVTVSIGSVTVEVRAPEAAQAKTPPPRSKPTASMASSGRLRRFYLLGW